MKTLRVSIAWLFAFVTGALFAGTTIDPAWGEGDDVTIAAGDTVVVTATTPQLNSLTVAGTLICSNWTTCVKATAVTVRKSGKITAPCAFTEAQMSNRVWVTCSTFDLQVGGLINMDGLGWSGRNGPGRGGNPASTFVRAAGHGGAGGFHHKGTFRYARPGLTAFGLTYGALSEPTDPGSGSCGKNQTFYGQPGGGAVRIDAMGHIKLNGSISACGVDGFTNGYGGSSGGSIWISCGTVEGAGLLSVAGGKGAYDSHACLAPGGGGGRLSLTWSDQARQAAYEPKLTFACGGTQGENPRVGGAGEPGTLYLTDASFFPGTSSGGGRVTYANPPSALALDALTVTGATLQFEQKFPVAVSGDLTIQNKGNFSIVGSDVTVGGNVSVAGAGADDFDAAVLEVAEFGKLSVGGGLTLGNNGCLRTDAGVTNETSGIWGVDIIVGGDVALSSGSVWYPCSHPTNLATAATRLQARSLDISADSAINGTSCGWQTSYFWDGPGFGLGSWPFSAPYQNATGQPGSSHGGNGGRNTAAVGARGGVYDNPKAPRLPGSGAGYYYTDSYNRLHGTSGGGQVWIVLRKDAVVNGKIAMNGDDGVSDWNEWWGRGSGGSVYLQASAVKGAGSISAKGGDSSYWQVTHWGGDNGGGGGGYVTFRTTYPVMDTFTGTIDVSGGMAKTSGDLNLETGRYKTDYRGWPGVITYLKSRGFVLFVR